MDFRDSPEDAAFRQEVGDFLAAELPQGFGPAVSGAAERVQGGIDRYGTYREWMKKLAHKGWIAPAWPQEYGGAGLSVMQQFILNEEFAEARAFPVGGMGVAMVGPTLII